MKENRKYVKNYLLSVLNTVLSLVFPIITFPYVSRVLGANNLGIINFAQSYGYYFIQFSSFGISSYAIREISKIRNDKEKLEKVGNEIFNLNAFFSFAGGLLYIFGVLLVTKFRLNWPIFIIYSLIVFTNFLTLEWLFQSFDDYWFTTLRSTIIRILSLIAVFVFVKERNDYVIYMFINTISEMGARFSALVYGKKTYINLRLRRVFLNFKEHLQAMFTLFVFRFVNGISSNLDKIMIGFFMVYSAVGVYSAGVKFVLMIAPIIETVGIVLFPTINIASNDSNEKYEKVVKFNYDVILFMGIPMTVGFFLVSPQLIRLFAGKEYLGAITVSRIMSVVILLSPIGDLLGSKTMLVHNMDKELLRCSSVVAICNVVLNLIGIPLGGIAGASIASIISYLVSICLRLYYTKKVMEFKLFNWNLLKYLLFTIPFVVIYIIFQKKIDTQIIPFFLFIAICGLIYTIEVIVSKDNVVMVLLEKMRK